jgi:hypothetical protein
VVAVVVLEFLEKVLVDQLEHILKEVLLVVLVDREEMTEMMEKLLDLVILLWEVQTVYMVVVEHQETMVVVPSEELLVS